MTNNDNFANLYDEMSSNYSELENIMGIIYQQLQVSPDDDNARELLERLGRVAKNMISSQWDFVTVYGDPSIRDSLVDRLTDKETALSTALAESKDKRK